MIHLQLEIEESAILSSVLEKCIEDLNHEISRTERSDYREMLVIRQELLKHILQQLRIESRFPVVV